MSGPLRYVLEHSEQKLLAVVVCQKGMANLSGEIPPPPSTQAVSDAQGPPALSVAKSVPPTQMTY